MLRWHLSTRASQLWTSESTLPPRESDGSRARALVSSDAELLLEIFECNEILNPARFAVLAFVDCFLFFNTQVEAVAPFEEIDESSYAIKASRRFPTQSDRPLFAGWLPLSWHQGNGCPPPCEFGFAPVPLAGGFYCGWH